MSEGLYQVERIVGSKQVRGVPYYKVHWAGYDSSHDTWEPIYNLDNCDELIEEYHSATTAAEKRRSTRSRSQRATKIAGEVSSDGGPLLGPVRRSQRTRATTHYFMSEVPTRRRRSLTPKPAKKTKDKTPVEDKEPEEKEDEVEEEETEDGEEEEEEETEEPFTVDRSEYELRSQHTTPRKSPRRRTSTHYFNSELPQPRRQHQAHQLTGEEGWIAEDTEVANKPHSGTVKHTTESSSVVLSSDEESQETVEGSRVSPRLSLYESNMRKRLNKLTDVAKKKVTEALNGLSANKAGKDSLPQPTHSAVSASHVHQTHSGTTKSQQTQPPVTRMTLQSTSKASAREKGTTTLAPPIITPKLPPEPLDPQPIDPEPSEAEVAHSPDDQPYPQWMQLGWEEVIFSLIILGLVIFAYYCFGSDGC